MNDLLGVEVEHACSNLPGPPHHLRWEDLHVQSDVVVQRPPGAELHDDTEARGVCAHTSGK